MATPTAPPKTPASSTSVDPLYAQALAQAKAALQPQIDEQGSEQAASDAGFAQQQTDATAASKALAGLLGGIGPQVQGDYNAAAQNQGLLAHAASAGMQDALSGNTDNLNAILAKLGTPATIASKAPQAADVLYGLGGYGPGSTFAQEGAAQAAQADMLPADAALRGQEDVKQLGVQAQQADAKFQANIAQIAAKLPGDTETNYTKLQSLSLENKKFALAVQNQKFSQAMKIASQKLAVDKFNVDTAYKGAQIKLSTQRLAQSAQRLAQSQFNSDRSYSLSLARLGLSQKSLQLRVAQAAFKEANGGFTQQQLTKMKTQALGIAQTAFHGTVRTTSTGSYVTGKLSYGAAMTSMLKKGLPPETILGALDQVYGKPNSQQEKEIESALGPLTPASLKATIAKNQVGLDYSLGTIPTTPLSTPPGKPIPQAQLPAFAEQVLRIAAPSYLNNANVQALVGRIMQESGGNPSAINMWDSNAKAGHPSKGILQTIDSTFNTYKIPGHNDIYNPLDNAVAAVRYMLAKYGHIVGPSNSGY